MDFLIKSERLKSNSRFAICDPWHINTENQVGRFNSNLKVFGSSKFTFIQSPPPQLQEGCLIVLRSPEGYLRVQVSFPIQGRTQALFCLERIRMLSKWALLVLHNNALYFLVLYYSYCHMLSYICYFFICSSCTYFRDSVFSESGGDRNSESSNHILRI
jgi:hypothetical protein